MARPNQSVPTTRGLRRRLAFLVLRETVEAYGIGLALACMTLVYVQIAWPPPEIRRALSEAAPLVRAKWFFGAHLLYLLSTQALTRKLLASARLDWWRQLPLSGSWWRALHLRHLLALHGPWLAMLAYALTPTALARPISALVAAVGYASLVFAAAIWSSALGDRAWPARISVCIGGASLSAAGVWSSVGMLLVSVSALGLAVWRLGRPLPQVRSTGAALRLRVGPSLALARAMLLAAWRRSTMMVGWMTLVHVILIGLLPFATVHGAERARALQRGMAVLVAVSSWVVLIRGLRALAPDRALLRSWPVSARAEWRARLAAVLIAGAPALILGGLVLARAGGPGLWWSLDLGLALVWAAFVASAASFVDERRGELFEPHMGRTAAILAAGLILVTLTQTCASLAIWALIAALRTPTLQARARAKLARRERKTHDDHGD